MLGHAKQQQQQRKYTHATCLENYICRFWELYIKVSEVYESICIACCILQINVVKQQSQDLLDRQSSCMVGLLLHDRLLDPTVARAISNYVQLWMCIRYNKAREGPWIQQLLPSVSLQTNFFVVRYGTALEKISVVVEVLLRLPLSYLIHTTTTKESKWKEIHMLLLISFITVLQPKQISFCCPGALFYS